MRYNSPEPVPAHCESDWRQDIFKYSDLIGLLVAKIYLPLQRSNHIEASGERRGALLA